MTIQQILEQAVAHHQAGRRPDAEALYRKVLEQQPNNVDALHLLGVLAHEVGRNDVAAALISRATSLNPFAPELQRNLARVKQAQGQLDEAILLYQGASSLQPSDPQILNDLGNVLRTRKRLEESAAALHKAIALDPRLPDSYNNLCVTLLDMGRPAEAIATARKLLSIDPNYAEGHYNLGLALAQTGKQPQAVQSYERALQLLPTLLQARINLGRLLFEMEQYDQSLAVYQEGLNFTPNDAGLHYNLGTVLRKKGQLEAAISSFQRATALQPGDVDALNNLGTTLHEFGKLDEALVPLRQALAVRPNYASALTNIGNVLQEKGELEEAIVCYRKALVARPDFTEAWNNLGNALAAGGQIDEALAVFTHAHALEPADANVASNLIYSMHYHPDIQWPAIAEKLSRWNQDYAQPLASLIQPHANSPDPAKRLRIGYVSPDFRQHVVGLNLLPLLREHDANQFEIFCYAQVHRPDWVTDQLKSHAHVWRNILGIPDSAMARLVREDQIDILVDLSLHTAHHRLLVFAQKPAPIQLTYLGYCSSTGLSAIDYRFSDPHLDPPELDSSYTEKTIRLPRTYWCYQPGENTPEPGPLPAAANGLITFGCLNNFAKVSDPALALWAGILLALPGSRLMIHTQFGAHRKLVLQKLSRSGVVADRVEFVPRQTFGQYIRNYQKIDIALDPFPYGGGITSCDALYMGVPLVTLHGKTAVGRGGSSILANLGLTDLVAHTPEQYQQIALKLAAELPALATLRANLREKMRQSPLLDAPGFARDVEQAYRQLWRNWCDKKAEREFK